MHRGHVLRVPQADRLLHVALQVPARSVGQVLRRERSHNGGAQAHGEPPQVLQARASLRRVLRRPGPPEAHQGDAHAHLHHAVQAPQAEAVHRPHLRLLLGRRPRVVPQLPDCAPGGQGGTGDRHDPLRGWAQALPPTHQNISGCLWRPDAVRGPGVRLPQHPAAGAEEAGHGQVREEGAEKG